MDFIHEFRAAIAAAGLPPPDNIIADGTIQKFSTNGRPTDKSGWYRLYGDDRPAGLFGCWRADFTQKWSYSKSKPLTAEEKAAWRKRMEELEAERKQQEIKARQYAATEAKRLWESAREDPAHPYLAKKQVPAYGARAIRDMLLIPIKQSVSEFVGLQRIWPDGTKRPIKGTPMQGAYTSIGVIKGSSRVVICEGWATGATIHMCTGLPVIVAFNSGNLKPVVEKLQAKLTGIELCIAADDDYQTTKPDGTTWNPGLEAAYATGLPVYVPRWYGDRTGGTDFNDLYVDEGRKAVEECFEMPVPPPIPTKTVDKPVENIPEQQPETEQIKEPEQSEPVENVQEYTEPNADSPPPWVDEPIEIQLGRNVTTEQRRDVDYIRPLPNCNDRGKPLSTIENVREITNRLGIVIRYNMISKEEEILIPGAGFSLDNRQNASLAWLLSECAKFRMPVDRVPDFVTFIADQNQYNPVANWIESKPWDRQDRLTLLMQTVTACGESETPSIGVMKRTFITKWMLSAVAAAFRPNGVSAHGVLVFQGQQYVGKTKWFKSLVPEELGVLKDGMLLRPDDRDSVMKCVSNWLVELGEIDATFRKSDIASLKSFLTSDRDVLRRAYARKESSFARRTVFFASVNPKNYLHDETGNRRYWTIECEHLNYDHGLDMQQVWAQVYDLYKTGESWFLSGDELLILNEHNKDFEVIDPIEDLIVNGLDWDEPELLWKWQTSTEILMTLGRNNPTKNDTTRAGMVIRRLNRNQCKRDTKGRYVLVPRKKVVF